MNPVPNYTAQSGRAETEYIANKTTTAAINRVWIKK